MEGVLDSVIGVRGLLLACFAGVVVLAGCGDPRPVTLNVRTELPEALRDYVEESFEAAYPEVDVRISLASTAESLAELEAGPEGAVPFDVWWGAEASGLEAAARAGLLALHRPDWLDEPSLVEPGGDSLWHPVLVTPFVIAFSREELQLTRAPRDWMDLRHFRWSDDLEMLDPARSEAGAWFVTSMLAWHAAETELEAGFDWLEAIDGQVEAYAASSPDAIRALQVGASRIAVLPRADVEAARADDAPWLYYRIPESGTPILALGVAIVVGTELADVARAFIDHVGSIDVRTQAKLETRWQPAYGDVDSSRLPLDFELAQSWRPFPLAVDVNEASRGEWLNRWEIEVRAR